jgi:hypothetical protein
MSLGGPGDNSDVLAPAFPGGDLSLASDPELLKVAQNTVAALNPDEGKASWFQANSFPKIYTQAVRAGYPAEKVMAALKLMLDGRQPYDDRGDHVRLRDNLTIVPPAHALEYVGILEAINSMLLQSHDLTIRVFPNWPAARDASFRDLRAYGAFLVSSEFKGGAVTSIDITSEVGGACTVANPWLNRLLEVVSLVRERSETLPHQTAAGAVTFETQKGGQYRIRPR